MAWVRRFMDGYVIGVGQKFLLGRVGCAGL